MRKLTAAPPYSSVETITEVMHGVTVADPYRWLEDQNSPRTREWLVAQDDYARSYLNTIPGRERTRKRIRELLDVETCDSIRKVGERYFFRKRLPGQEQSCIYLREGAEGKDQLLIDPAERGTGPHTSVKPLRVSRNGSLLLYEVKEGGERTGIFEIFDIEARRALSDNLPRGYLPGFAFAPDGQGFYYVHLPVPAKHQMRAAFHHVLGKSFERDRRVFFAGDDNKLRLHIVDGKDRLGFLVHRFFEKQYTDFYLWALDSDIHPRLLIQNAAYRFAPMILKDGRILALTDHKAPNGRIVKLQLRDNDTPEFIDVIPETDAPIRGLAVTESRMIVSYMRAAKTQIRVFDLFGALVGELPTEESETVRFAGSSLEEDEMFVERESFTTPVRISRYSACTGEVRPWATQSIPFDSDAFGHNRVWFTAKDGVQIPMFLVGRRDVLESGQRSAIMTAYGGYGVSMTPLFSVFVAFLLELGCLFALPNIRGGSEFGVEWHNAAKGRNRQTAFNDFISAAEWLIETGRTQPTKLAIFGGSNSGLLVGAAMTQRPELFRAVVCMVPMLDMLRYHLFDSAHLWEEEFGTSNNREDFQALLAYSPYHQVREGTSYPATMIVSGDADQNCNPLHARKMTARLQAANASENPVFLDYSQFRGHSPALPVSDRVDALTDRMAFLCDQLGLST